MMDCTTRVRTLLATADIHFGRDHPSAVAIRRAAAMSDRKLRAVLGTLPRGLGRWLTAVYEGPVAARRAFSEIQ